MPKIIKSHNINVGEPAKVEAPTLNLKNERIPEEIEENEDWEEDISEQLIAKEQKILEKAKIKAQKIIDDAMEKIEEEREIVLEQGKKNGFEEGYNQSLKYCEDIIQEAGLLKQQAMEACETFLGNIENEVIEIIIDVAKKVVGTEIKAKNADILPFIKEAFENCQHREYVVLKVSKDNYKTVVESKNKLLAMVQGVGEIEIKMDHSLEAGSCLLETPYGNIDGSINTRLNEIKKVFKGLVGKE